MTYRSKSRQRSPKKPDWKKKFFEQKSVSDNLQKRLDLARSGLAEAAEICAAARMFRVSQRFKEGADGLLDHFDPGRFDIPF